MQQWIESIISYLAWFVFSDPERKLAEKQILQQWNFDTIDQFITSMMNQLNRDIVTKNQLIRAFQKRNEKLAQSIIMSSPIGTRIKALRKLVDELENQIERETRDQEEEQTRVNDTISSFRKSMTKWNMRDPEGFSRAQDYADKTKRQITSPDDPTLPKPVPTPTPQPTPTPVPSGTQNK